MLRIDTDNRAVKLINGYDFVLETPVRNASEEVLPDESAGLLFSELEIRLFSRRTHTL
jgi:hypothetical protein